MSIRRNGRRPSERRGESAYALQRSGGESDWLEGRWHERIGELQGAKTSEKTNPVSSEGACLLLSPGYECGPVSEEDLPPYRGTVMSRTSGSVRYFVCSSGFKLGTDLLSRLRGVSLVLDSLLQCLYTAPCSRVTSPSS